ncbi:uncharacterized protein LOC133857334 [Alnus glutinosa]|uniref:uncharacterized protein LOC133857334 n=1 Tax=Alnus glutinosa TaxID=3517 RepID=UPI002D7A2359|nr:uncharacterized protein LOC133857334 [Alnus glutinosa]
MAHVLLAYAGPQRLLILRPCAAFSQPPTTSYPSFSLHTNRFPPFLTVNVWNPSYARTRTLLCRAKASRSRRLNTQNLEREFEEEKQEHEEDDEDEDEFEDGFSARGGYRGREEEKDYDRDPEFAEILGSCLDDPQKARSKMEERLRRKRNKILQSKTGSAIPMKVTFNKFDFSNSLIWFEFYNTPLEKDIALICDAIRSWHIIGRLGGVNSLNMQLSQSPLDKRPSYDGSQGANVTPTTFYNIGDLEIQDNLARFWVDIGTSEPLLLDVLINALTQISTDIIGIKQLMFGGSEFENWKENLTSEDAGCSVHKI